MTRSNTKHDEAAAADQHAVAFVMNVRETVQVRPDSSCTSSLASDRLRALIPAREIAKHRPVWLIPLEEFARAPQLSFLRPIGAIVISKLPAAFVEGSRAMLDGMLDKLAQQRPDCPVFADLTDNYTALGELMGMPYLPVYQRRLAQLARFTTCGAALAQSLTREASLGVHVIDDPFETPEAAARAPQSAPLRLLWFGNFGSPLYPFISGALGTTVQALRDLDVEVEFVAHESTESLAARLGDALRSQRPGLRFRFSAWSPDATPAAIDRCDIVLLPQEHKRDYGRAKSANRLVAAIRGGRIAVASPIPAYEELARFSCVGEDLAAGVRWAIRNTNEARSRVIEGQKYVAERFSPQTVGKRWLEVLRQH